MSTLAELATLDRPTLAERWTAAFGVPAPKSCQATLLRQALAWHLQMQTLQARSGTSRSSSSTCGRGCRPSWRRTLK